MGYQIKLSMQVLNGEGKVISETKQEYNELDYQNLVTIEKAVVGSLVALGEKKAEEKSQKR
jgi:hypothetical protein